MTVQLELVLWDQIKDLSASIMGGVGSTSCSIGGYPNYMITAYNEDMKEIKDEEKKIRDEMDGGCDDTEEDYKNFLASIEKLWEEAQQYWSDFVGIYTAELFPYINLAGEMEKVRQRLEKDVAGNLGDFEAQLGSSQIGATWKGAGAEGYAKQIPIQVEAMVDLKNTVNGAVYHMASSAMAQQNLILSVLTSVSTVHARVSGVVKHDDNMWADRISAMRDGNLGLKNGIRQLIDLYTSSWRNVQNDGNSQVAKIEQAYTKLSSSGSTWPAATVASEGYKPNGEKPTSPTNPTQPPPSQPETPTAPNPGSGVDDFGNTDSSGVSVDEDKYE